MAISTYLLTITLNVNGLNASVKKHRMAEWFKIMTHRYAGYKRLSSDRKTHTV